MEVYDNGELSCRLRGVYQEGEVVRIGVQYGQEPYQLFFKVVERLISIKHLNGLVQQYFAAIFANIATGGIGCVALYLIPLLFRQPDIEAMLFLVLRGVHNKMWFV